MFYLALFVVLAIAARFGLKNMADGIKNHPNPYSFDALSKALTGTETYIEREDGTRIWAISEGQGKTVVLSHGYGVTSEEWNLVWDALLKAGYRVIAFDLRGHGRTNIGQKGLSSQQMVDDYRAVLEYFDVRDGVLVGHSTGGFLTVSFLLKHPQVCAERIKGAVIVAGLAGNVLKGSFQNRLQIPLIQSGILLKLIATDTVGWLFGASVCGDTPFPAAIQVFNKIFLSQKHELLIPILHFLANENHYPNLSQIKTPCVIVCGEKDKTTPAWHSQDMGHLIPTARNVWVKGKGHLLNWEAPEIIIEAIKSV